MQKGNKQKGTHKNPNQILAKPEELKKLKSRIVAITEYLQQIDDLKEGIKETIEEIHGDTGLDKKQIRKLATTMYKNNFSSLQEENEMFEFLYDIIANGRKIRTTDPLDDQPLDEEDDRELAA
jgi:hypothetical protein